MEMCRVCLATENGMYPLNESFITHYNLLTSLNIRLLDGLPQFTCKTCTDTVKYYIEFREKSIASETTLREIICSSLKSEYKNSKTELVAVESTIVGEDTIKSEIKDEIKVETQDDSDNNLDNEFGVTFGEYDKYDSDVKNIVKNEEIKPKKRKRRKHKKEKEVKTQNLTERLPDDDIWCCGICPKIFKDKNEMNQHLDVHKNDRQCDMCKEGVNSLSQLLAHRLLHVPAKQLRCHICDKRYRACLYLEHHYRTVHIHTDGPKLICNICLSSFADPKRMSTHTLLVHSEAAKVFCDYCSKGFPSKSNLRSHIKQHGTTKSYRCDLCDFSCKYSSGLKDHKVRKHAPTKVTCKNCIRVFEDQEQYDKHKCKKKLKICNICGVQLTGNARLSTHLARHSAVSRFPCPRCPARYRTRGALVAHLDRHDGNRRMQCEYCPASFYTAATLIKHRRIHTGEKPYVCRICNKGFTGGNNLKVHMRVHGEYLIVKKNSEQDNNIINVTK